MTSCFLGVGFVVVVVVYARPIGVWGSHHKTTKGELLRSNLRMLLVEPHVLGGIGSGRDKSYPLPNTSIC